MRVSIDTITNTIVDTVPNAVDETTEFIVKNGYEILDIPEPFVNGVARELTSEEVKVVINNKALKQIEKLENSILRAYREVLSNNTTQEVKDLAQAKIDDVEAQIQQLRTKLA